eukprot:s3207_g11.t1
MAAVMSRQNAFVIEDAQVPCIEAKNDGGAPSGEGGDGREELDANGVRGPPGGEGGAGGEGNGNGGDGRDEPHPEDEDEHKEDEEEEEGEKDPAVHPELPPNPEGSYSSSEPAWIAKGYSNDDILQKKHQKEVRRATAKSAVALLDRTQEEIPQNLTIQHMETIAPRSGSGFAIILRFMGLGILALRQMSFQPTHFSVQAFAGLDFGEELRVELLDVSVETNLGRRGRRAAAACHLEPSRLLVQAEADVFSDNALFSASLCRLMSFQTMRAFQRKPLQADVFSANALFSFSGAAEVAAVNSPCNCAAADTALAVDAVVATASGKVLGAGSKDLEGPRGDTDALAGATRSEA